MTDSISSTNIPELSSINEVLGNAIGDGGGRISVTAFATQLLSDGPIADVIGSIEAGYEDSVALVADLPDPDGLDVGALWRVFGDGEDSGVWKVLAGTPKTWDRLGPLPAADLAVVDARLDAGVASVAAEVAARLAGDEAEATARAEAIAAEATARGTAISGAIATEVTNRNTAISTAVAGEATARGTAISGAIASEVTRPTQAISTAVAGEATA
ncbi:hypothetical protein, partial [Methylobrevis pamukkalensis]|uniref:hypothetical protein n=1 Tax=Methylobrevis pamukkalensis TaxID=1439726 RepID=UPI001AECDC93